MASTDRLVKRFGRFGAYQTTKAFDLFSLDLPSDDGEDPPQEPTSKLTVSAAKISKTQARVVLVGGDPRKPFKGIPALSTPFANVDTKEKLIREINADQEVTAWLRNYGLGLPEDHHEVFLTYTNSSGVRLTIRLEDYNLDVTIQPNSSVEIQEVLKLDKLMKQLSDYMFVDDYNKDTIRRLEADMQEKDAELAVRESEFAARESEIAELKSQVAALQLINDDLEEANKNRARMTRGQTQAQQKTKGKGKRK